MTDALKEAVERVTSDIDLFDGLAGVRFDTADADEFGRDLRTILAALSEMDARLHVIRNERCKRCALTRAECADAIAEIEIGRKQAEATLEVMASALLELFAVVKGECPSLLNEDSGGFPELGLHIETTLSQYRKTGDL